MTTTPFDVSYTTCDHAHATDRHRDCGLRPTFVILITTHTGEACWSAACGAHTMSALDEGRDVMAKLSLPARLEIYTVWGADRRIHRGSGRPIALDSAAFDRMAVQS